MKKLIVLLLVIGGGYWFVKYYYPQHGVSGVMQAVEGIQTSIQHQDIKHILPPVGGKNASTGALSALTIQNDQARSITQKISQLSAKEIASSSPQIQQILKQLQKLPNDKIKATCQQVCGVL